VAVGNVHSVIPHLLLFTICIRTLEVPSIFHCSVRLEITVMTVFLCGPGSSVGIATG
jgi:hypothetical protein